VYPPQPTTDALGSRAEAFESPDSKAFLWAARGLATPALAPARDRGRGDPPTYHQEHQETTA
jgi:hypothetical protein